MSPSRVRASSAAPRYARGLALALALAGILGTGAHAQVPGEAEIAVRSVEFSPRRFVPGDTVTARIALAAPAGGWRAEALDGPAPVGMDEPTVLSLELEPGSEGPSLVVRFIPWVAGETRLPELRVGGLVVPSVPVACGSALAEKGEAPPAAFAQLAPEGLYARLYLLAGLGLALVVASLAAFLKGLPAFKAFLARRAERLARKALDEALRGMSGSGPEAWAVLCAALRRFAGIRAGLDLLPLTPGELRALGPGALPGAVTPELAALLETGDEVRYGGRDADAAEAVASATALADRMDAALEARA